MLPTKLEEMTLEDLGVIDGYEVVSSDGHWVGSIDLVFSDEATGRPEWLGVWNGEPLSHRRIVPIRGATREIAKIHVRTRRTWSSKRRATRNITAASGSPRSRKPPHTRSTASSRSPDLLSDDTPAT